MPCVDVLWHLDPDRFARASSALAALFPVDEATLGTTFAELGGDFAPFADWARQRAPDLLANNRDVVRCVLREALTSISRRRGWSFEGGLAGTVHVVVGCAPQDLAPLYRLSGGPPIPRKGGGIAEPAALAELVEGSVDQDFDLELPERFAPEPGEGGLEGAWTASTLEILLPVIERVDSRPKVDALLEPREKSLWGRVSGDAKRATALRAELDRSAWSEWSRVVEAVREVVAARGLLGYDTELRPGERTRP